MGEEDGERDSDGANEGGDEGGDEDVNGRGDEGRQPTPGDSVQGSELQVGSMVRLLYPDSTPFLVCRRCITC